jgi:hypothetical protein
MVRGVLIPARLTHPITVREFECLEDYQSAVGGYIQPLDIERLGLTIYINEEGRLQHLEPNPRATYLWWYHAPESRQAAVLVGDAVLIGQPDAEGESTDLPDGLLALFLNPGVFRIDVQWHGSDQWMNHGLSYDDYFEALVWAMILNERFTPKEVKVVGYIEGGQEVTELPKQ